MLKLVYRVSCGKAGWCVVDERGRATCELLKRKEEATELLKAKQLVRL